MIIGFLVGAGFIPSAHGTIVSCEGLKNYLQRKVKTEIGRHECRPYKKYFQYKVVFS